MRITWSEILGEIPPRARRRAGGGGDVVGDHGNTSACAEKSAAGVVAGVIARKYLRVRGEELHVADAHDRRREIPPRARRRVTIQDTLTKYLGNTSACAEKSSMTAPPWNSTRKYLRVRGEERVRAGDGDVRAEIPPRARRRGRRR